MFKKADTFPTLHCLFPCTYAKGFADATPEMDRLLGLAVHCRSFSHSSLLSLLELVIISFTMWTFYGSTTYKQKCAPIISEQLDKLHKLDPILHHWDKERVHYQHSKAPPFSLLVTSTSSVTTSLNINIWDWLCLFLNLK